MAIANNFFNGRPTFLNDFANGQTLDNRITFLRSGAATYYDGKSSALAEQNLLLGSNNFTTSWSLNSLSTPIQNATDPSGTASNAWTITPSAVNGQHILSTSSGVTVLPSTNYTFTMYLQAGGSNFALLVLSSSSTAYLSIPVNLTSGSVALGSPTTGASFTYVSSSITQVGSTAWYRVALTFSTTLTSTFPSVQITNSANPTVTSYGYQANWVSAGTETLLVYGAQLEQRSTATAYNQTTTTAINNFIPTLQSAPVNTPRFNFNPVTGESLGLLVEGSSTNLCTYSNGIGGTGWTNTNATANLTANIAPDGTQTMTKLIDNTTSGNHETRSSAISFTTGTVYTISFYAKAAEYSYLSISTNSNFNNQLSSIGQYVNISTGNAVNTLSGVTVSSQPVGNGVYRFAITATSASTSSTSIYFDLSTNGTSTVFAGTGNSGVYLWGCQFEAAQNTGASSALTSFIATTSASVTRAAEYPTVTATNFSTFFNNSQGTWYVEAQGGYYNGNVCEILSINNASGIAVQLLIAQYTSTTSSLLGTAQLNPTSNASVNGVGVSNKLAYTYTNSALVVSELGVTPLSSATNNSLPTATNMAIGYRSQYGDGWLNGHIKKLAYYPTAMTGANLQALTGS